MIENDYLMIRISKELKQELKIYAEKDGVVGMSAIVKAAVIEYMIRYPIKNSSGGE